MDIIQTLAQELDKNPQHVKNVVQLLDEGNTIPFIARYRKELHGAMDDTSLRTLEERLQYLRGLAERRETVKKSITVPLASFIFGIYLMDTILSVRSAFQLSSQMGKLRELQTELKDYVAEKREENQERKAERRAEVRERARALRDSADIFERRLLHSHPDIRKSREDLLAAIRARLNESEAEAKRVADGLFNEDKKD